MELDEYLAKLRRVLATRRDLFVIACTDSADMADIERRVLAFADAGADAVLVNGLNSLDTVRSLATRRARPVLLQPELPEASPFLHAEGTSRGVRQDRDLQHALFVGESGRLARRLDGGKRLHADLSRRATPKVVPRSL